MTDQSVPVETDENSVEQSRFNTRKAIKVAAITALAAGTVLVLKRKFNATADGELNVTVETNNES